MKRVLSGFIAIMIVGSAYGAEPKKIDSDSPKSYWEYRIGIDMGGGATVGDKDFYYGIYDNSALVAMDMNFGFIYKHKYETELSFNVAVSSAVDSPEDYGYYYTDISANGVYYGFSLREHYYMPISSKWKFDVALGYGYYWENVTIDDDEDLEYIKPQYILKSDSGAIEIMAGLWWRFHDNAALRFGYKRVNFLNADFPIDNVNSGYLGVSYVFGKGVR